MKYLVFLLVLFLGGFANGFAQDAPLVTEVKTNYKLYYEGEELFEAECAQCHGINERMVSVGLADVHTKRSREWLLEFLQRPQTLEYKDDYETRKYKEEYGTVNHTIIKHLNESDYNKILDFAQSEYNGAEYNYSKVKEQYFVIAGKDIKVGDYKYFYPDGSLSHHYVYNNGLPWKVIEVRDVFGTRVDGGTLIEGNGTIVTYDKYGNKESETNYIGGFRNGDYMQYYDGGQLEMTGYYSNGKANGQWTYFYTSGEVKNYINYQDGRILSNREGDKPDVHPGIRSQTNYNQTVSTNVKPAVKEVTIIYPYNEEVKWELHQTNNDTYKNLGHQLVSQLLLKEEEKIYQNSSAGFKRFHPPAVMESYMQSINGWGEFQSYRLDNVGFSVVNGRQLVLLEFNMTYAYREVKMYVNYIRENGQYVMDGWSFE